jgi:hypothetical protein
VIEEAVSYGGALAPKERKNLVIREITKRSK